MAGNMADNGTATKEFPNREKKVNIQFVSNHFMYYFTPNMKNDRLNEENPKMRFI